MPFSIILLNVALIWFIAVITPGPNFFITVKTAVGQSRRTAFFVALGTSTGAVIWGLSGFLGIALLFKTAPWIYLSFKLLGGGYLVYLGLKLFTSHSKAGATQEAMALENITSFQGYKQGLLTNLANPKTAVFVTSLFAATMPSNAPLWIGVTSVAEMSIISIFWYTAIAHIFSSNRFKKLYLNSKVWIERFSGIVFIGFGVKLLVKE
ncbi:MAG: LysE family transporter [Anaerolineae bacterium]|jgi:threonine/homoserine/homoserine lactone efflux protein|nr:LysE family transporter [Anaerolineae bacterium]MBT3713944.1 LysE family transporter [Anaerolineae bacterium]MBT4310586.1 LysE family transporter [Anaerolineae bacterium]MBT4458989.1 LysE family transporter [Anaerolineae bacterium]MBT4842621.1 LysE family transporter [Anaerolineae bacterium]